MLYFRLYEDLPSRNALGYGTASARWNNKGTPIIYVSNSSAINFIELLSIKGPVVSTAKWLLATIDIVGDIPQLDPKHLPEDWNARPYPTSTQQFGTQWAQSLISPYLKVPSCRIPLSRYPHEHNLLINPSHPERNNLMKIISTENVSFEFNRWGKKI